MPLSLEDQRAEQAFNDLCAKFPKRYKVKQSRYLRGLLKAISTGCGFVEAETEIVGQNLVMITAVGKHLDRLAAQRGTVRGQGSGVQDDDFRELASLMGYNPKQITGIMNQLIDTIYGPYSCHANATCSLPEPYNLYNGSSMAVRVDQETIEVTFRSSSFISIGSAKASEVATAVSEATRGRIIGSVVSNITTGESFVNLRSSTVGAQGFIQVLGGDAQAKMGFPEVRGTLQNISTWDVSVLPGGAEVEFTVTAGVGPSPRASGVRTGDTVNVRLDSGFAAENTGFFEVTGVGSSSFRCKNPSGSAQTGVTQAHVDDLTFYRPDVGNVLLAASPATVLQTHPSEITVMLPVTSPLVKRTLRGCHHFHGNVSQVQSVTSNSMTLASTEGFASPAGAVHVLGGRSKSEGSVRSVGASSITLVSGEGWPQVGAMYSNVGQAYYYYTGRSGDTLTGVTPAPPSSIVGSVAKYSRRFMYTGVSGSTLTGMYPSPLGTVGLEVGSAESQITPGFPGSFLYDPAASYISSDQGGSLDELIEQGTNRTLVQVAGVDLTKWPDRGYVVFEGRTSEEEGPVKYLSKIGSSALVLDPSHLFQRDHLRGTAIRMVRQLGPYVPRVNGQDLAVYTTSTSPARDLIVSYLRAIAATGMTMRFLINTPDYKWNVLPLLYATNPLDVTLT